MLKFGEVSLQICQKSKKKVEQKNFRLECFFNEIISAGKNVGKNKLQKKFQ